MERELDSVKLSRIKAAVASIEKHFEESPERLEDIEVSFEYVIGSFFPKIWEKIQNTLKEEHTRGFIEGFEAGKKEALEYFNEQMEISLVE